MLLDIILRIIFWAVLVYAAQYVLLKLIPRSFMTLLGAGIITALILFAIVAPANPAARTARELLKVLVTPLGLSIVLLAITFRKGIGKVEKPILAAFSILFVLSTPLGAGFLANYYEGSAIAQAQATAPASDAIVLLGWDTTERVQSNGTTDIQLSESSDRLLLASALYQNGAAPEIIVSAGPRSSRLPSEAQDIQQILVEDFGIPAGAIRLEERGLDIRTSAEGVKNLLDPSYNNDVSIVLVSSAIHSTRAERTFVGLGFDVTPRSTDFGRFKLASQNLLPVGGQSFAAAFEEIVASLIPSVESLSVSTNAVVELVSNFYYYMRGWIPGF